MAVPQIPRLIYNLGDAIRDPETGEVLGDLETIRGTGIAVHVQAKMSTIRSDMRKDSGTYLTTGVIASLFEPIDFKAKPPQGDVPFSSVSVGDSVRMIS